MDNVNVEEKWQETGLLEGAVSAHSLAHILDATSGAVQQVLESGNMEREHVKYIATTIFPIVTRALNNLKFTCVSDGMESKQCATVFVKEVATEDEMLDECAAAGAGLNEHFSKINGLNLSHIRISSYDKGYHIGLDYNALN